MDRRLVITISFLILALAALTIGRALQLGEVRRPPTRPRRCPEPAPCAMSAPPPVATARDAATVAVATSGPGRHER